MMKHLVVRAVPVALAIAMAACGGGGSRPRFTPTPTPSPTPTPTPAPQTPLVAFQWAPSPAPVLATGATPSFANPGGGTTSIPLLMTAVNASYSGDQATVDQGARLDVTSSGVTLVVNNPAISIQQNNVSMFADTLDYTRFGHWTNSSLVGGVYTFHNSGAFVGGYQTPAANLPSSGSATYNGTSTIHWIGNSNAGGGSPGQIALTANFGTGAISGSMTGFSLLVDEMGFNGPFNDMSIAASLLPGQNLFTGTLAVTSTPGGFFAAPAGTTGTIQGLFFGPSAQEVGGAWMLGPAFGTFGAKN
jgi:hypothetical protein